LKKSLGPHFWKKNNFQFSLAYENYSFPLKTFPSQEGEIKIPNLRSSLSNFNFKWIKKGQKLIEIQKSKINLFFPFMLPPTKPRRLIIFQFVGGNLEKGLSNEMYREARFCDEGNFTWPRERKIFADEEKPFLTFELYFPWGQHADLIEFQCFVNF
jgi:hypothetical protein